YPPTCDSTSRLYLFFYHCSAALRDLPSFPTRRSSDLKADAPGGGARGRRARATHTSARRRAAHRGPGEHRRRERPRPSADRAGRSEEHTSELQSRENLVCRLLLEKKKKKKKHTSNHT